METLATLGATLGGLLLKTTTSSSSTAAMVLDQSAPTLAQAVLALERVQDDPQAVLTHLVQLHDMLVSRSMRNELSLAPATPSLSASIKLLHTLLLKYLDVEQEIVWFLCRIVTVWSRACRRAQFEAGRVRLWEPLQSARATYPESPRILESSLEATFSLFDGVELHQLLGSGGRCQQKQLAELLALMDRFDQAPTRTVLLSPHFDFSSIVVLALGVLRLLLSSSSTRIVSVDPDRDNETAKRILQRLIPTLPHFLTKSADATSSWLAMCRLQQRISPRLALECLFLDPASSPSWCQQITRVGRENPQVAYDLAALFTQMFAVPLGPNALAADTSLSDLACRLIADHGVVAAMVELLDAYSSRVRSDSTTPVEREKLLSVEIEVVRCLRQLSCIPEFLTVFPSVPLAAKTLVPLVIAELECCNTATRATADNATHQLRLRLLLELLLLVQQLALSPLFARIFTQSSNDTLPSHLSQIHKRAASIPVAPTEHDAGDSQLHAVLAREAAKTAKFISALLLLPPPRQLPSASRRLQRLPSSTMLAGSLSPTISKRLATTSSALTVRRPPIPSTSSSSSLLRSNKQTHPT